MEFVVVVKLNNNDILVDTWSYSTALYQVCCLHCFMSSSICEHATTYSSSPSMSTFIPFPVLISNAYFCDFLILLVTFDLNSHK